MRGRPKDLPAVILAVSSLASESNRLNKFAISSGGMGEALQRSSAAMHAAGNSLEETAALVASANTVVQDPQIVGTTLKTVSMFLRASKVELEEAGESTEGMANSVSELQEKLLALTEGRVNILTDAGNYKGTYQILKEIAAVWDDIVKNQGTDSAAILELLGGKRNANAVAAILENFKIAEDALAVALNSSGSALAENEIYLDSIAGKTAKFQAAWESLSATVVNGDVVKVVVDFGTALVNAAQGIAEFSGGAGGIAVAFTAIVAAFDKVKFLKDIVRGVSGAIPNLASNISLVVRLCRDDMAHGVPKITALSNAFKVLTGNITATGKAALIALAAFAAFKVLDAIIVTTDEAIEKHTELASKFRDTSTELNTLSTELENVKNRIDELNKTENPELVDQEEVRKLQASADLLAKQVEYKRLIAQYDREQAADAAYAALTNDPVFGDDILTETRDLQSEYESLEKLRSTAYDKIATMTPGSGTFNSKQAEIEKFELRLSELDGEIASKKLEISNLYTSLLDDDGVAVRSNHQGLIANLKVFLGIDESSLQQTANDAGDAATQVAGAVSDATKKAFSSEAKGELDKSVNDFQSRISTLSTALKNLVGGELDTSDVVDLMQEFPELAPYVDIAADGFGNLEEGLRKLVESSPDSVIETLRGFEETYDLTEDQKVMIDSLCTAFQMMANDALNAESAIDKVNKVLESANSDIDGFQSSVKTLSDAMTKLQSGELGVSDIVDLLQEFPELAPYIDLTAENFGDLENGLKSLIGNSPDKLIDSLQKMRDTAALTEDQRKQIDLLCEAAKRLSSELTDGGVKGAIDGYSSALGNFANVADKINSVSDSLKTVADLQNEVANGFTVSLDKALEFAAVYPEILNGATVSADGQIELNEDVVNSFISGKEAELKSQIDEQITALEADKETLEAKRAFAEAQLELAKSVGEGEGQISHDVLMYRVQSGTAAVQALIDAGFQEADAYRMAAEAMSGNIQEFNSIAAEVCKDSQGNFNLAAYNMAQAIYLNMNRAKQDVVSYTSQVHEAAKATNAMQSGLIAGSTAVKAGSKGGVWLNARNAGITSGSFSGTSATKVNVEFELRDLITQLELDISEYESAISQIDGQIAALKALRDRDLGSFTTDKPSGGGKGSSDADEVSDALEAAEEALRDAFKDYLNDMEHYISLLERNNNSESSIIDAYKRMMDAVHEEAERARANGEDEHSDYIQELQDQWWAYHDEIEKIRDDITENAKSAMDELVDYRIDMLKQQLEEEKDALDAQLNELKEFYDKQKDMLREQYDEKKYLEEQAEKRKAVSDLEAELESLRYDDSAWAQKRRAELEAELADARKELDDFEEENALDEVEKLLDEQYEKQAALIQDQIDAIEEKLNDPEALFNQALADIRNSTEALYQEMVEYNAKHGDGNEETIRTFWEECFAALKDYEGLFGEAYNGVNMDNATGYKDQVGQVPTQGGGSTSSGSQTAPPPAQSAPSAPSTPTAPSLEKGSYVQVKDGVKWYETSDGTGSWGRAKSGKIKYISKSGTHRYNIDGAGWVRKQDIVGYASGTSHATAGIHEFGENGDEVIFTSADGSKYRIFSDGEKVLNAKATNFLYDFANTFGGRNHAWDSLIGGILGQVNNIGSRDTTVEIHAGDIIVQGNADERTVSDIRRIKREQMNYILKEIGRLNK